MGRIEKGPFVRTQVPPEQTERLGFVYGQVRATTKGLLERGGAILHGGIIVAHRIEDLDLDKLSPAQEQVLSEKGMLSARVSRLRAVLPEGIHPPGQEYAHIISPHVLEKLFINDQAYGRAEIRIGRSDSTSTPIYYYYSLTGALANHIKAILLHEGFVNPSFVEGTRFANNILADIARENEKKNKQKPLIF